MLDSGWKAWFNQSALNDFVNVRPALERAAQDNILHYPRIVDKE